LRSSSGDWIISEPTESLEAEMGKLICAAPTFELASLWNRIDLEASRYDNGAQL